MAEINIEKMAQNVAKKAIQELRDNGVFVSRWIPVSERIPEVDDEYIITIRERWGKEEEWDYETTTAYYDSGKWSPSYDVDEGQEWEVIAWMPLPEPMKVGEENC